MGSGEVRARAGGCELVLPNIVQPSADLFVYYPSQRNQSARARAFIDFLSEHFKSEAAVVDS